MKRPARWLLLTTGLGLAAYFVLDPPREQALTTDREPLVVRRAGQTAPEEGATLHGRVLDRLGWPVESADIRLVEGGDPVISDASGFFELAVPANRGHRVRIAAPHHETTVCRLHPCETRVLVLGDALPVGERRKSAIRCETDEERADWRGILAGRGWSGDCVRRGGGRGNR